jgi:Mn-dependent DtxR family transcriptional regulator
LIITEEEANRKLNHPSNIAGSLFPANGTNGGAVKIPSINNLPDKSQDHGDDESRESDKDSSSPPAFSETVIKALGRNTRNLTEEEKVEIGSAAIAGNGNGSGNKIAEMFGVSPTTVSRYKNLNEGRIEKRKKNKLKREMARKLQVNNIRDIALAKTLLAIGGVDAEAFAGAKLLEKSAFAKDMSNIYRNLGNSEDENKGDGVKLIVMAPMINNEKKYDTIEVESKRME